MEPNDLPSLSLMDMESANRWGIAYDERPLSTRWDKNQIRIPEDYGWIGEDEEGIWTTVHPHLAYADRPELVELVERFLHESQEMTADDWRTLSAWEYDVKCAMVRAAQRKGHGGQETRS